MSSTQDVRNSASHPQNEPPGRPKISQYVNGGKFEVDDKVMVSEPGNRALQGPLFVASVPQPGKYTLRYEDGSSWSNGKVVDQKQLEPTT